MKYGLMCIKALLWPNVNYFLTFYVVNKAIHLPFTLSCRRSAESKYSDSVDSLFKHEIEQRKNCQFDNFVMQFHGFHTSSFPSLGEPIIIIWPRQSTTISFSLLSSDISASVNAILPASE